MQEVRSFVFYDWLNAGVNKDENTRLHAKIIIFKTSKEEFCMLVVLMSHAKA
jgi:hypothetical protein